MENPEDITPVPEDSDTLQTYIQDRRVIGVSVLLCYLCLLFGMPCTLPQMATASPGMTEAALAIR